MQRSLSTQAVFCAFCYLKPSSYRQRIVPFAQVCVCVCFSTVYFARNAHNLSEFRMPARVSSGVVFNCRMHDVR